MSNQLIIVNGHFGLVRREILNGNSYLVAPFVSLRPRVLAGSKGKLFYPASEIAKNPGVWNHVPITLGHPANPLTNLPESARQPSVLNRVKLGEVYEDAVENGERKGEAWFDEHLTKQRSPVIWQTLNDAAAGKRVPAIELSTGLFTDDIAHNGVTDEGQDFEYVATNYRPDHLAVFEPGTARGACSVDDGCGIGVNAQADANEHNEQEELAMNEESPQTLVGRFLNWLTRNAGANQTKNLEDGQFMPTKGSSGKQVGAAVKRGFGHQIDNPLPPRDDPDDDGDSGEPAVGQGDRDRGQWREEAKESGTSDAGVTNSDQPRDEQGRFSSGGSFGGQATAPKSSRADEATDRANSSGSSKDHEEAEHRHFAAGKAHQDAGRMYEDLAKKTNEPSHRETAKKHHAAASKHYSISGEHAKKKSGVTNEDGDSQSGRSEVYAGFGRKKEGALERAAAAAGSAEARQRAQQITNTHDEDEDDEDLSDNGDIIGGFKRVWTEGSHALGLTPPGVKKQTVTEKSTPPKAPAPAPTSAPAAPTAPKAPATNLPGTGAPVSIESVASSAPEPSSPVSGTGMSGSPLSVGPTKNQGMTINCPECGRHMTKNKDGVMSCNCGHTMNMESVESNGSTTTNEEVLMAVTKQRQEAVGYLTANCDCWKGKANVLANEQAFTDADLEKLVKNAKKAKQDELVANSAQRGVRVAGGTLTFNSQGRATFNEKAEGSNADVVAGDKSADGRQAEVDPEEEVDPSVEGSVDVGGKLAPGGKKGTTMNQWLNRPDVPAELKAMARNYAAWEANEKQRLIGLLTQNVRDGELKKRLTANHGRKSLEQLQDEAAALPTFMQPLVNQHRIGVQPEPVYGAPPTVTDAATENRDEVDVLPLPTMNWSNEAQSA